MSAEERPAWLAVAAWNGGVGKSLTLSQCPYYRGVGTCTFGCHDYPQCMDLGPPRPDRLVAFMAKVYQRLNAGARWTNVPDPDDDHVCKSFAVLGLPA